MSEKSTAEEILEFAINAEQESADLYEGLAKQARNSAIKKSFLEFAKEELGHKAKILEVKAGNRQLKAEGEVMDLKLADYVVDLIPGPDADYQDVLIYAMKKEKAAFRLYSDLAAETSDAEIKGLLLGLAQEEAKHKLRFEVEYDEVILIEN